MAYTAPNIKDRIAVGDNKYTMQSLSDGRIMLIPAPDSVTEPGTDIGKGLLQPALDAIAAHESAISTTIPQSITNAVIGNTHGWETKSFTSANFSNKQYAFAVPYKRFLMYPTVNLSMVDSSSYYYDKYSQYMVCDVNTLTMLGWYLCDNGDSTANDSNGLTYGVSCPAAYAHGRSGYDDQTAVITITSTGLKINYYGSGTLSSITGDIKILQI